MTASASVCRPGCVSALGFPSRRLSAATTTKKIRSFFLCSWKYASFQLGCLIVVDLVCPIYNQEQPSWSFLLWSELAVEQVILSLQYHYTNGKK